MKKIGIVITAAALGLGICWGSYALWTAVIRGAANPSPEPAWLSEVGRLDDRLDEFDARLLALRDTVVEDITQRILLERELGLVSGRLSVETEKSSAEILELSGLLRDMRDRVNAVRYESAGEK